ncbi:MAG: 3-dehydroquinate synthase [Firmicutes bacterium]|jgi:shikimate kinase/3-dehydroquinate synthase|nr:3-dehydroquinate synthase [Bacillota bacterium]
MIQANLVLTGMMGAGKTTVGRILARRLGKEFVDLDHEIEKEAGVTIRQIFEECDEARFRTLEAAILQKVLHRQNQVIATGGGVVVSKENLLLLQGHPVVWLAVDADTAAQRLTFDGTRPLVKASPAAGDPAVAAREGMAKWSRLADERRAAYSMCDLVVDASQPPDEVAADVFSWWERVCSRPEAADTGTWKLQHLPVDVAEGPYLIHIGRALLSNLGQRLRREAGLEQVLVVSNPTVLGFYRDQVAESLNSAGLRWEIAVIPDGEEYKTLETVESIYEAAFHAGLDRRSGIVALGGGVVGDIAGFAAATYMRGVKLVQVPTTLLAQVDSSVGGKVGVNHPRGKNLIGAFYQPVLVAADLAALETLPSREVLTGMAEIIKCGFIADKQLVSELEAAAFSDVSSLVSSDMLIRWVKAACDLKARVVAADAKEMGYREILNFGHTVGHGVEKTAGYGRYTHGEAVAIGMVTAAILSYRRGYLSDADCRRIISLIDRWGLPTGMDSLSISEVVQACRFDKKVRSGRLRFVLLESVGKARVGEIVDEEELADALKIQAGGGLW